MDDCLQKYPDLRVLLVARTMRLAGLRLDEAVRLRVSEIQDDRLSLDGHSCKNGRPRRVPLTPDAAEFFQHLKAQAGDRALVFETARLRGLVQRVVKATAGPLEITDRRSHNFRAHYANELYQRLRADGISDQRARRTVVAALGHGRISVLKHYLSPMRTRDDGNATDQAETFRAWAQRLFWAEWSAPRPGRRPGGPLARAARME